MLDDSFDYVCSHAEDLTEPVKDLLRTDIKDGLGSHVIKLFPSFASAFPITASSIEMNWPAPVAAFRFYMDTWLSYIVSPGKDSNLFFTVAPLFRDVTGEDFDRYHSMLPEKWKELYRFIDSFVILKGSSLPLYWTNTPFRYAARLDLGDYSNELNLKKIAGRDFRKKLSSHKLRCWLLTDAGDALFLDELHCNHKVYHVKNGIFDDVYVLNNPENTLDRYLAHYVSGGAPADFDFRQEGRLV